MNKVFKSFLSIVLCLCMLMPSFAFVSSAASVGQVKNLAVSSSSSKTITLKWSKVSGAKGYKIYKYNSSSKKWSFQQSSTKTTATVEGLSSAKTYKFKVRAYKGTDKKVYGEYSAVLSASTTPSKVKNLKSTGNTTSTLTLKWSAVNRATGYRVFVYDSNEKTWKKLGATTATTCKVSGLTAGQKYKFKVYAYYNNGTKDMIGAYSSVLTTAAKPEKVDGFKVIGTNKNTVTFTWTKVSGATKYQIYKYVNGAWSKAAETSKNTATVSATTTAAKYKVRAILEVSSQTLYGDFSAEVSAAASATTVDPKNPAAPTNMKLSANSSTKSITISWTGSPNVTGYQVETYDYATGSWKIIATTSKTSYQYSVSATGDYYFRVRSFVNYESNSYYSEYTAADGIEYTAPGSAQDDTLTDLERYGILGYMYDAKEGCFYNTVDAIHRVAGFSPVYDIFGPVAICFYDTVRLDFTYSGLDWRIQLWKGQYGWCFIGGESGVYTRKSGSAIADFYACASNENMLQMSMVVYHLGRKLFTRPYGYYWWCTGYVFGINPGALGSVVGNPDTSNLKMVLRITMRDETMRDLFIKALDKENFKQGATYLNSDTYSRAYIYSGNDVFLKWI